MNAIAMLDTTRKTVISSKEILRRLIWQGHLNNYVNKEVLDESTFGSSSDDKPTEVTSLINHIGWPMDRRNNNSIGRKHAQIVNTFEYILKCYRELVACSDEDLVRVELPPWWCARHSSECLRSWNKECSHQREALGTFRERLQTYGV